jgi:DNA repair protein RadC
VEQLPLFIPDREDETCEAPQPQFDQRRRRLQEALAEYSLDTPTLRRLAETPGAELRQALLHPTAPELEHLIDVLSALLRPELGEQITRPQDLATILMVEMGYLDQEELWVACLSTKNHLQKLHTVYKGSLNSASVRVAEVFKEPLRLNSAAIIVTHNHPSGIAEPSPDDVALTCSLVRAGQLLDCKVLDHLVIGQGQWVSLRERGLGFTT